MPRVSQHVPAQKEGSPLQEQRVKQPVSGEQSDILLPKTGSHFDTCGGKHCRPWTPPPTVSRETRPGDVCHVAAQQEDVRWRGRERSGFTAIDDSPGVCASVSGRTLNATEVTREGTEMRVSAAGSVLGASLGLCAHQGLGTPRGCLAK